MIEKDVKMILKKVKQKKGVSLMISYVLLISIVLALSVGVYSWLKFMAEVKPVVNCKDDTSVIIEDFSCDSLEQFSNLELMVKNTGRFNIDGVIVIVGNNSERAPSTYLMPEPVGGLLRGHYYFKIPLKPGERREISFTNKLDNESIVDFNEINVIEIQPFITTENERVLCQDAVIRQRAEGCTIFDLAEWEGLISWWAFDEVGEVVGEEAIDSISGYNGSLEGGASIDEVNGVLVLDNDVADPVPADSGKYVLIGLDKPSLEDYRGEVGIQEELTLSSWVRQDSMDGDRCIFCQSNLLTHWIKEGVFKNILRTESGWTHFEKGLIDNMKWTHLVIVYNFTKMKHFVDGDFIGESGKTGNFVGVSCSQIGRYADSGGCTSSPSDYFDGEIDNVMIFNRALSVNEIKKIYNVQKVGKV